MYSKRTEEEFAAGKAALARRGHRPPAPEQAPEQAAKVEPGVFPVAKNKVGDPAPETALGVDTSSNSEEGGGTDDDLSPQQKAAITRAKNKEEAEAKEAAKAAAQDTAPAEVPPVEAPPAEDGLSGLDDLLKG